MSLLAMGERYDVAQVSRDFVVFRGDVELPPCDATLTIHVDETTRKRRIHLVNGASPGDRRTSFVPCVETLES